MNACEGCNRPARAVRFSSGGTTYHSALGRQSPKAGCLHVWPNGAPHRGSAWLSTSVPTCRADLGRCVRNELQALGQDALDSKAPQVDRALRGVKVLVAGSASRIAVVMREITAHQLGSDDAPEKGASTAPHKTRVKKAPRSPKGLAKGASHNATRHLLRAQPRSGPRPPVALQISPPTPHASVMSGGRVMPLRRWVPCCLCPVPRASKCRCAGCCSPGGGALSTACSARCHAAQRRPALPRRLLHAAPAPARPARTHRHCTRTHAHVHAHTHTHRTPLTPVVEVDSIKTLRRERGRRSTHTLRTSISQTSLSQLPRQLPNKCRRRRQPSHPNATDTSDLVAE